MNNSYLTFIFSNLPLSVAVAVSFDVKDDNIEFYETMWEIIGKFFNTSRSKLISFSHITEDEFNKHLVKVDFRIK